MHHFPDAQVQLDLAACLGRVGCVWSGDEQQLTASLDAEAGTAEVAAEFAPQRRIVESETQRRSHRYFSGSADPATGLTPARGNRPRTASMLPHARGRLRLVHVKPGRTFDDYLHDDLLADED